MIVSLTRLEKLCLCAFVVGVGVFVMGFSVPYWVTFPSSTSRFGLWELCSTEGAGTCCFSTLSKDFRILGERLPGIWHWFAAWTTWSQKTLGTQAGDVHVTYYTRVYIGDVRLAFHSFLLLIYMFPFLITVNFGLLIAPVYNTQTHTNFFKSLFFFNLFFFFYK